MTKRLKPVTKCLFKLKNQDIFTLWKKNEYNKLLQDNIIKTYKRSNSKKLRDIYFGAKNSSKIINSTSSLV